MRTEEHTIDLDRFLRSLRSQALPEHGRGECAQHLRDALAEADVDTAGLPILAKDWGPTLARVGFAAMSMSGYVPVRGDIVVFQPVIGAPYGHVQAYDGSDWISDFVQEGGFWPRAAYRHAGVKFMPYRNERIEARDAASRRSGDTTPVRRADRMAPRAAPAA